MDEVSPELSSISSGCLISLAIASGETAKLLAAANCLLLTLPDNSAQTRVLPVHESFKIRLFYKQCYKKKSLYSYHYPIFEMCAKLDFR